MLVGGLFACKDTGPRILDDAEGDLVGKSGAGAASYDRLINGVVAKLLSEESAARGGTEGLKVAFLGVENAGIEEIVDWQESLYELIDTSINQSDRYRNISRRFVDAAMREARLQPDDLFLPRGRRAFSEVLEAQGNPVDCLLFAKLTTGSTRGEEGARQRNYNLTMELVDIETGMGPKHTERIRKAYGS